MQVKSKKKLKYVGIGVVILIVAALVFFGVSFILYKTSSDPYRGTTKEFDMTHTFSTTISRSKAIEDVDYMMKRLSERHPACIEDIPLAVQAQYQTEIAGFGDEVSVLDVWRASAAILAQMKDGHTAVRPVYDSLQVLPLSFEMKDSRIYARNREGLTAEVSAINGIPVQALYKDFITRFSYEIESFAAFQFTQYIATDLYLSFMQAIPYSATEAVITFRSLQNDGEEYNVTYAFEDPSTIQRSTQNTQSSANSFVFYTIDTAQQVAVLTLQSCIYNDEYKNTVERFFTEVRDQKIKSVVVDLRDNGGGNSYVVDEFIRYLPVESYYSYGGVDIRLGNKLKKYPKQLTTNNIKADVVFDGTVYVLTSVNTFSSATDFAARIQDNNLGIIVGDISGNMPASYGDILYFTLPNSKLLLSVSYKYFGRIDETKKDIPLIPDYEVPASQALETVYSLIGSAQ